MKNPIKPNYFQIYFFDTGK